MKSELFKKDYSKDFYKGLKGIYFNKIIKTIIEVGQLHKRNIKILDFGCGSGKLKKILGNKVINYDVQPNLTEIKDWKRAEFDVVVANEVFYLMEKNEIRQFLQELRNKNKSIELIVGIERNNILNHSLKYIFFQPNAYIDMKTESKEQLKILKEKMEIIDEKPVFAMMDVYKMRFKNTYYYDEVIEAMQKLDEARQNYNEAWQYTSETKKKPDKANQYYEAKKKLDEAWQKYNETIQKII